MDLGQVFTVGKVADYMVKLLTVPKTASIIDPCFGGGAFLNALKKAEYTNVVGCEIDASLFQAGKNSYANMNLYNEDFLGRDESEKFDALIMNPPYVRHEKINDMKSLGVSKSVLATNPIFDKLPSTANLYMYFIVKGFEILKNKGEMVVIFPSSWIQARSGKTFQKMLNEYGCIERHINISGEIFEQDALVEVVILKIIKGKSDKSSAKPEYIRYIDGKLKKCKLNDRNISLDFDSPFSAIGKVRRGLTTGFNQMFINPELSAEKPYIKSILSSPKDVNGFSTSGSKTDLLFACDESIIDAEAREYITSWEGKIKQTNEPQTLLNKMSSREDWYKLALFDCKGIIFSYFVRNDMKFIFNESDSVIRDNFYVIYPMINPYLMFGLLNNYYTFYQLECCGKKYGAGLLKLQRYDIEDLYFPCIEKMSSVDIKKIISLAKKLIKSADKSVIDEITHVIASYSSISDEKIREMYLKKTNDRLEAV